METVFDVFQETPYEYLIIKRGQVYGDRIVSRKSLMGIFKVKNQIKTNRSMEVLESDATLHAHPEDFDTDNYNSLIGNGVYADGEYYSIKGISVGKNFDNGVIEHIFMRLQVAKFVEVENG